MNKLIAIEFKITVENFDKDATLNILKRHGIHLTDIDEGVIVGSDYTEIECRADTRDDLNNVINVLNGSGIGFYIPE